METKNNIAKTVYDVAKFMSIGIISEKVTRKIYSRTESVPLAACGSVGSTYIMSTAVDAAERLVKSAIRLHKSKIAANEAEASTAHEVDAE